MALWFLLSFTVATDLGSCRWKDFKVKSTLGKGGHGIVVKAEHKSSGKLVALKIMSKEKESQNDLKRESSIHSSLSSPFISKFYCQTAVDELGFEVHGKRFKKDDPVFVIELVDGKSMRDLLKKQQLNLNVKDIVRQLVEVIKYMRNNHVVFGDLSSGNVMITSTGRIKLIDFGAALRIDDGHQVTKPVFVSRKTRPDRWHNYASDWYALGLLIEELMVYNETGRWQDQRIFHQRKCDSFIHDKLACDFIGHLIPSDKNWSSIWGQTDGTIRRLLTHPWLNQ